MYLLLFMCLQETTAVPGVEPAAPQHPVVEPLLGLTEADSEDEGEDVVDIQKVRVFNGVESKKNIQKLRKRRTPQHVL